MNEGSFRDHFSGHASAYRDARPTYSRELFAWLATLPAKRELVWDVGCGNGQASVVLAEHFDRVVATDASSNQIDSAEPHSNVEYRVEPAERSSLPDASVDLIAVAQALHWMDQAKFYAEVRRIAAPGGAIAVWTYALCNIDAAVDPAVWHLYDEVLGKYWPPERAHTMNGYADLPFPFEPIPAPKFDMEVDWTLAQFTAYLRTWSSAQRFLKATGRDAVSEAEPALGEAWGDPAQTKRIRWPLAVRAGRVAHGNVG